MREPRLRRVGIASELDAAVEEYLARGYYVAERSGTHALVKKDDLPRWHYHLLLLVFMWWSFGFANLLFALTHRSNADEVLIRIGA